MQPYYNIWGVYILEKYCLVKKSDLYRIKTGNIEQLRHREYHLHPSKDCHGCNSLVMLLRTVMAMLHWR